MKSKNSAETMSLAEIDEVIADLEKEKEDREYEERFNLERLEAALRVAEKQPG